MKNFIFKLILSPAFALIACFYINLLQDKESIIAVEDHSDHFRTSLFVIWCIIKASKKKGDIYQLDLATTYDEAQYHTSFEICSFKASPQPTFTISLIHSNPPAIASFPQLILPSKVIQKPKRSLSIRKVFIRVGFRLFSRSYASFIYPLALLFLPKWWKNFGKGPLFGTKETKYPFLVLYQSWANTLQRLSVIF